MYNSRFQAFHSNNNSNSSSPSLNTKYIPKLSRLEDHNLWIRTKEGKVNINKIRLKNK